MNPSRHHHSHLSISSSTLSHTPSIFSHQPEKMICHLVLQREREREKRHRGDREKALVPSPSLLSTVVVHHGRPLPPSRSCRSIVRSHRLVNLSLSLSLSLSTYTKAPLPPLPEAAAVDDLELTGMMKVKDDVTSPKILDLFRKSDIEAVVWCAQHHWFWGFNLKEDPETIDKMIAGGEASYNKWRHHDPYIVPWSPGGSKFTRNPTPPSGNIIA